MMSIAVVGAGAIGGFLGVRLAHAGERVTFIARGANLAAIRANGMRLVEEHGSVVHADVAATDSMAEAGVHDIVLVTLKAHQVGPIAADLARMVGPHTTLVTMQNGVPWWYFSGGFGGAHAGAKLQAADPGGLIAAAIDPARVVGSVVYPAAVLTEPGVVEVVEGNRFGLGELDGSRSERVLDLSQRLVKAGFKAPVTADIRSEIWLKLLGNASLNPVSALTHATLETICRFPDTRLLIQRMMEEAQEIATDLGVTFKVSIDKRIAGAEKVGAHKTSMLQDIEAGRPIELEALLGSVIELGQLTKTATPHLDTVYTLMRLLGRSLAEAGGRLAIQTN